MKNCLHCRYAEWDRTKSGKLHSSGDGQCKFIWTLPPLPSCKYWISFSQPKPNGGRINRKEELKDHCVYYEMKK